MPGQLCNMSRTALSFTPDNPESKEPGWNPKQTGSTEISCPQPVSETEKGGGTQAQLLLAPGATCRRKFLQGTG